MQNPHFLISERSKDRTYLEDLFKDRSNAFRFIMNEELTRLKGLSLKALQLPKPDFDQFISDLEDDNLEVRIKVEGHKIKFEITIISSASDNAFIEATDEYLESTPFRSEPTFQYNEDGNMFYVISHTSNLEDLYLVDIEGLVYLGTAILSKIDELAEA